MKLVLKELLIWKADFQVCGVQEEERLIFCLFNHQMTTVVRAGLEPLTSPRSPNWVAGNQGHGPFSPAFEGISSWKYIRNEAAAETRTRAHEECWCHRQWFEPLHHNATELMKIIILYYVVICISTAIFKFTYIYVHIYVETDSYLGILFSLVSIYKK